MFILLGVEEENPIKDIGEMIPKSRFTHYLSFLKQSVYSINSKTLMENLPDCWYGFCFLKLMHQIQSLRFDFPSLLIFLLKLDLDAAHLLLHFSILQDIFAITVVEDKSYIE